MTSAYRFLALSDHWLARVVRGAYRFLSNFSMPAPRWLVVPWLAAVIAMREAVYFVQRVFWCEPLFKAYCTSHGRRLKTGVFLHWVQGKGRLTVGDNVTVDGKSSFVFAVRYCDEPALEIGSNTIIGHNCSFTVGKKITVGSHCLIAGNVQMFDSPGHAMDPAGRKAGQPARIEDVLPIVIEDNVWIGRNAIIFPGVRIGEGSVVAMGTVVMNSIPPNTVVAGNPARQIRSLAKPD